VDTDGVRARNEISQGRKIAASAARRLLVGNNRAPRSSPTEGLHRCVEVNCRLPDQVGLNPRFRRANGEYLKLARPPYVNTDAGIYLNCLSLLLGVVMSLVRRIAIALIASVGLLLASVVTASAATGGVPFTVELTGEAEVTSAGVPNQGDLDGSGTAHLTVNPGTGEVCWSIDVTDVEPIRAAHIHKAPSTTTGGSLYISARTLGALPSAETWR